MCYSFVSVPSAARPPRHIMTNSDVQRIINSDEVQRQLKRKGYGLVLVYLIVIS